MQMQTLNFPEYIRYCADNFLSEKMRDSKHEYSCDALFFNDIIPNDLYGDNHQSLIVHNFLNLVDYGIRSKFGVFSSVKSYAKRQQYRHAWLYFLSYVAESFIEDITTLDTNDVMHSKIKNFTVEVSNEN